MGGIDSIGNLTNMDMHGTRITSVSDVTLFTYLLRHTLKRWIYTGISG